MAELLYYHEDFPVGRVFISRVYDLTPEEIKAYAREFDWLPFHVDEATAAKSFLGGLCASGWHASSIVMRLMCDSYLTNAASMGSFGVEEAKWLKPVRPGKLKLKTTVLSQRVSSKRPEMGICTMLWELCNDRGELLVEMRGANLVRVRAAEAGNAA